jgi:RNA polymerase sigma-70 factor (ECF subfamily)
MDGSRKKQVSEAGAQAARIRLEAEIRELLGRGEAMAAAQDALWSYGPEIFGFLVAVLDDRRAAGTVYANTCRHLERHMATVRWTCSLRTWMYAIARQELRLHRCAKVRRSRPSPPSPDHADAGRTPRRHVTRNATVAALRRRLPPEDRELLILRIDRGLHWRDVAITALGPDASRAAIAREIARLRARMRAVRDELALATRDHERAR